MPVEDCRVCGGDGQIHNAFGLTNKCPACHGTGRRSEDEGLRDVTKTKPAHFRQANKAPEAVKRPEWPTTFDGGKLATEVRDSATTSAETKGRLIQEIIDYEGSHGSCTKTFMQKVRKQIRILNPR